MNDQLNHPCRPVTDQPFPRVVALSGGVGGARFVHGLARALPAGNLRVIVNTGDDFEHWGLHIAPDVDTVMYTLADLAHVERGWGLATESFAALEMVRRFGGEDWFALGDRDLATHVLRTQALRRGETLSAVTHRLCKSLGVGPDVIPMADAGRQTIIETRSGEALSFQDWFVRRHATDAVRAVRFEGTDDPSPGAVDALRWAEVVLIGPSNPYVSIDPILSLRGIRELVAQRPVVAVSPIVGGRAVKGPLASMIVELADRPPTPTAIRDHYGDLVSALVVEHGDGAGLHGIPVLCAKTVMHDRPQSRRLAEDVLAFAGTLLRET